MARSFRFNVGSFDCAMVADTTSTTRISGLLPSAPEAELQQVLDQLGYPIEAVPFSVSVLSVKTPEHHLLIDTGKGASDVGGTSELIEGLAAEGIAPESIDLIIITHG